MQLFTTRFNNTTFNTPGMEIEKEIKQTVKFGSEFQKMAINILFTASWLDKHHTEKLKPYGLTPQQFNILRILRGQFPNPATVNLLIERMLDKSSNASRLVDRLLKKGFVSRCVSNTDKRAVNILITENGLSTLSHIDGHAKLLEENLHSLTNDEAKELNRLLDKLRG